MTRRRVRLNLDLFCTFRDLFRLTLLVLVFLPPCGPGGGDRDDLPRLPCGTACCCAACCCAACCASCCREVRGCGPINRGGLRPLGAFGESGGESGGVFGSPGKVIVDFADPVVSSLHLYGGQVAIETEKSAGGLG